VQRTPPRRCRNDLDSANRVLRRFIADYHRRLARAPRDTAKAWRPAPENIERICSFLHERIVSNDNVVQWEGHRFQIPPQNRRFSFAGAKVQLYQALVAASRSTTAIPASNTPMPQGGDIFMLPLGDKFMLLQQRMVASSGVALARATSAKKARSLPGSFLSGRDSTPLATSTA